MIMAPATAVSGLQLGFGGIAWRAGCCRLQRCTNMLVEVGAAHSRWSSGARTAEKKLGTAAQRVSDSVLVPGMAHWGSLVGARLRSRRFWCGNQVFWCQS